MTKPAINARELEHFIKGQAKEEIADKTKRSAIPVVCKRHNGKTWADLTGTDKDDIMRALAIAHGIVLE